MSDETSPAGQSAEFQFDCIKWRRVVLTGKFAHWCNDWDGLPVDETCDEFTSCHDVVDPEADRFREKLRAESASAGGLAGMEPKSDSLPATPADPGEPGR
jgi:hypothetical protein